MKNFLSDLLPALQALRIFSRTVFIADSKYFDFTTPGTAKVLMGAVDIPRLGPNSNLNLMAYFNITSSATPKVISVYWGPNGNDTDILIANLTLTNVSSLVFVRDYTNNNSVNSQSSANLSGTSSYGTQSATSISQFAVNTAVPTKVSIYGTAANAPDTIRLFNVIAQVGI